MRVPLVRTSLGDQEINAVASVIRSGWVTQGPEVAKFERDFASAVGAEHAVAVSNCTVALQLALIAVGVKTGDEVVTVSHTFIATVNAILAVGGKPALVDVRRDSLGMDARQLEQRLSERSKAVICVHQIGIPCDLQAILEIAARHKIPVIEDAACALGSEVNWAGSWERIGRPRGEVACFSFHPRKIVTTGDGGMLTTGRTDLAARFRLLRHHGMSLSDTERHASREVIFEEYLEPAFNFRLTDVQAAMGRSQLARLDEIIEERRNLAQRYNQSLASNRILRPFQEPPSARWNWQSYPVTVRLEAGLSQKRIMQHFLDQGISTKRGISNVHQEPAYRSLDRWTCGVPRCPRTAGTACPHLAVSEALRDEVILLPLYHGMSKKEQDYVIEVGDSLSQLSSP